MRLMRSLESLRTSVTVLGMGQVRDTGRCVCLLYLLLYYGLSWADMLTLPRLSSVISVGLFNTYIRIHENIFVPFTCKEICIRIDYNMLPHTLPKISQVVLYSRDEWLNLTIWILSVETTNKMQPCNKIYYSKIYWKLNMFPAAYRSSSEAPNCICSLWFIYPCGDRPLSRLQRLQIQFGASDDER